MLRWLALGFALLGLLAPLPVRGADADERPVPVVDLDVHLPFQLVARGRSLSHGSGQADPTRLRRGGVIGVVLPLVGSMPSEARRALEPAYHAVFRALVDTAGLRIPGCRRPGPGIRTWLAIEGARELAEQPTEAAVWAARGVRFFGLVRDEDNELATSAAHAAPPRTGLSPKGVEVVREIHEAGGVVDVSHASKKTLEDVVALARNAGAPVVATHSNARALVDDSRNLDDDALRTIASTGGVVGITFNRRLLVRGRDAELSHVVRHVLHVARVAGIEHVAMGSGFEGGARPPREMLNAARYPRLVKALLASGLERESVKRVMAGNALRVLCPSKPR